MVTIPYPQLQNIAIPVIDLLPHNFKISPTIPMELFCIDIELIPIILFWSRKVSIIITIVSDITVLVSHNVILFGYIMPMSYGINKKTAPSDSCNLPPSYQVFMRYVCCFTINTLSTFFCSDQIITKYNAFSIKTNCFYNCCSVLISLFCVSVCFLWQFCTVLPSWNHKLIISFLHGFRFGLPSNYMTQQLRTHSFSITRCCCFCC